MARRIWSEQRWLYSDGPILTPIQQCLKYGYSEELLYKMVQGVKGQVECSHDDPVDLGLLVSLPKCPFLKELDVNLGGHLGESMGTLCELLEVGQLQVLGIGVDQGRERALMLTQRSL